MEKRQQYEIENPTDEVLVVYEVGRFEPGKSFIDLTEEQVKLLENNATLKTSKYEATEAEKPEESRDRSPRKASEQESPMHNSPKD